MPFFAGSVRKRMLLLVLFAVVPVLVFILHSAFQRRDHEFIEARDGAARSVGEVADILEHVVTGLSQLLTTMSQLPEVQGLDSAACGRLFGKLLAQNPGYANITLCDPEGRLIASALPASGVSFADRLQFREAVRTRDLAAGEYIVGRTTGGLAILPFAVPVLDAQGRVNAVLGVSLRLDHFEKFFGSAPLPPGSTLLMTDHKGVRLYQSSTGGQAPPPGEPIDPSLWALVSGPEEKKGDAHDCPDGVRRIFAYRQMRLKESARPYLHLVVEIPEQEAFRQARTLFAKDLSLLCLTALVSLIAAWVYGERGIGRAIRRLVATARRIGQGDFDARTGIGGESGELGELARSMDEMAAALDRDLADHERAEQALRTSAEQIHALFNATTDSAMLLDARGTILAVNEEGARRRGMEPKDLVGKGLLDIPLPREVAVSRWARIEECRNTRKGSMFDEAHGDKHFRLTIFPICGLGGEVIQFASFSKDITEQVLADRALREALSRAEDLAVKAQAASTAKSVFLATMSHELRTPLNGMLGMLQLLGFTALDAEQKDLAATATLCGRNLLRLLNDILDLSRIEAGRLEILEGAFKPREMLDSVLEMFRHAATEKGLRLEAGIDAAVPPVVSGDEIRMKQILFNLVGNAIKFTEQGEVSVELTCAAPAAGRNRQCLTASVRDTGIGIPEDKIPMVFEPFTQLDGSYSRKYPGAGLGLAIVKRLVGLLGGELGMRSTLGQGTVVTVCVPVRVPSPDAVSPAARTGPVQGPDDPLSKTAPLRVLVAEDEETNLLAVKRFLEKLGHSVACARNGAEVLDILRRETVDAVLMDIQMPEMDGMEATRRIRAGHCGSCDPRIPIIAISAHAMVGDRERFLASGMDGYLAKPVEFAELEELLRTLARARQEPPATQAPGERSH